MRRAVLDVGGGLLLIATVAWIGIVKSEAPTIVLAAAGALVIGRLAGALNRALVPGAVLFAGAFLVLTNPDIASHAPLSGPFSYSNATGAFFVLVSLAALMLAVIATNYVMRWGFMFAAAAAVAVPVLGRSMAPTILIALAAITAAAAGSPRRARVAVVGLAVLFIAALLGTILIASRAQPGEGVPTWLADPLTERRMTTWNDAWRTMQENPSVGVGIGRFPLFSEAARYDPSSPWAHNEFLQFGAEGGAMAFGLLTAIFVWAFVRLAAVRYPDRYSVLGAGAVAAAGIHASIDGILRFWPVPVVAALIAGTAAHGAEQ